MIKFPASLVVLTGDCEWYYSGSQWNADFHKTAPYVNLAYLDGHAAHVKIVDNADVTTDYSFAIRPEKQLPQN
jgi:prepilin-type processing-associated H-X9-DG protein